MFANVFDQIPLNLRNQGPSKIFVAHSYRDKRRADLRGAVRRAFEPELTPYYADTELGTRHLLIKSLHSASQLAAWVYLTSLKPT